MDMTWLAAILSPRDVAPHENFRDSAAETSPGLLGLVVQGKFRRLNHRLESRGNVAGSPEHKIVELAAQSVELGQVRAGAEGLGDLLVPDTLDPACATAAGLLASVAFSEVEDLDAGLAVLHRLIPRVERDESVEARLLEAALCQQRAMRTKELGLDGLADARRVLELLSAVDVTAFNSFVTSESIAWDYQESYTHIVAELRRSAQDLLASEEGFDGDTGWRLLKEGPTNLAARAFSDAVHGYDAYIDELYETTLLSPVGRTSFEDPVDTGVWRTLLHFELAGNVGQSMTWRRRLGQLRLLRIRSGPVGQQQDTLRLLRHSGDLQKCRLAIAHVRGIGPLAAVAEDARSVLRHRSRPERLRDVDLVLLAHAAQVLTASEAAQAFGAVLGVVQTIDLHGPVRGASPSIRVEHCWQALVALAPVAQRVDEVALAMLRMVSQLKGEDALLDRALARGADQLDWNLVSPQVQLAWREWLRGAGGSTSWSSLSSTVAPALTKGDPDAQLAPETIAAIAQRLNTILGGEPAGFQPEELSKAVLVVREALIKRREEAAGGSHSFGGVSEADVAVGMLVSAGAEELAGDVAAFLTDSAVWRRDKAAALERLAREASKVPTILITKLKEGIDTLLNQSDRDPFGRGAILPFPEALRLASALRLMSPDRLLVHVVRLSGADNPRARLEAARTLAVALTHAPVDEQLWSVALALQLSRDNSPYVRSEAGRALAHVAASRGDAHHLAMEHLLGLLAEDGLLVPLLALRGLNETRSQLPQPLKDVIAGIARSHPAYGVRLQAAALLTSRLKD
jgi:hypothetical protein